ncbi:MAG: radical SAM protein [Planctomycetota bacterium]
MVRHSLAKRMPSLIQPRTRKLTVAITAYCNLRCVGCKYGRDFMPGKQLSLGMVKDLLEDGRAAGVETVRLYGGEPLLHPDLPAMIAAGTKLGLRVYVTTNGILLEERIDELYAAGLRDITIGYYGDGAEYDSYVQKRDRFERLERGVAAARERYPDLGLQLNFLVMRPTATVAAIDAAWAFARRYDMSFHTDLIHYSLPYFVQGREGELQFRPEDRASVQAVVDRLLALKAAEPKRIPESAMSLRSIPDWLFEGPDMRIPCDVYKMLWVGADGSVKLCYVTFDLGNLHDRRLSEILNTRAHQCAARDAFQLQCPNCHCERDSRIRKDFTSRQRYAK